MANAAWRGRGIAAAALRGALLPAAGLFRGVVAVRNGLYDRGIMRARSSPIAVVSVGNLSVGGAGKTPVAAWLVRQLTLEGASAAVVMRGYGNDETIVHRELNPEAPVLVYADRAAGVEAAARIGCDVAVLDDAFQHRAAERDEDVVLISADAWGASMSLLPAGPWREPVGAVRRATLAIVTAKAAPAHIIDQIRERIASAAPSVPLTVARLAHDGLRSLDGKAAGTLASLAGRKVLAVAAVADPAAFFAQLEKHGVTVTRRPFPDHHAYKRRDVLALRESAAGHDALVCTLKDAVKLRQLWPADAPPAWYVSQTVRFDDGSSQMTALIQRLLAKRDARRGAVNNRNT